MSTPPNKLRSKLKGLSASRDATDNIAPKGTAGYKPGEVEDLKKTADYWESPEMLRTLNSDGVSPAVRSSANYGAMLRSDAAKEKIPDATLRKSGAEKAESDLGLQSAIDAKNRKLTGVTPRGKK